MNKSREYILSDKTQFVISEAYKNARANLMFSLATCDSKIVVVTSANSAEGKSTNCLNMAITMAAMDASVLLIDADMRKPVVHSLLKLNNKVGLSSILGKIINDISQGIHSQVRPNLDILTAGPIPPNPSELLSSPRMTQILNKIGSHYDYVFIDTPPVNIVSDALLLNSLSVGILFVVREGVSNHTEIAEALGKIEMAQGKVLGFLKADCDFKSKSGYSYNKYKYNAYKRQ